MALHALAYCERLFYLEEVEEIRVADQRVFAGRQLHLELAPEDGDETRSWELSDENIGLTGKVGAVRRHGGDWVPYELKRGRARSTGKRSWEPWPSDRIQIGAYALLLRATTGMPVKEALIRYHRDSLTITIPVDDALETEIMAAVARARELRLSPDRPSITPHEGRCVSCSLAPVCLPEEERVAAVHDHETVRLFPPMVEETVLQGEDSLLVIPLCACCAAAVQSEDSPGGWETPPTHVVV